MSHHIALQSCRLATTVKQPVSDVNRILDSVHFSWQFYFRVSSYREVATGTRLIDFPKTGARDGNSRKTETVKRHVRGIFFLK